VPGQRDGNKNEANESENGEYIVGRFANHRFGRRQTVREPVEIEWVLRCKLKRTAVLYPVDMVENKQTAQIILSKNALAVASNMSILIWRFDPLCLRETNRENCYFWTSLFNVIPCPHTNI